MSSQVLKIGLTGSELTLPTPSRILSSDGWRTNNIEGIAASGRKRVDFGTSQKTWTVQYEVISESNYEDIRDEFLNQENNDSFLNFIITDEAGTETNYEVQLTLSPLGNLIQGAVWNYDGLQLDIEQTDV